MVHNVQDLNTFKQHDALLTTTQAERISLHLGSILTTLKIYGLSGDVFYAFSYVNSTIDILSDTNFEKLTEFCNAKGLTCNLRGADADAPVLLVIERTPAAIKAA